MNRIDRAFRKLYLDSAKLDAALANTPDPDTSGAKAAGDAAPTADGSPGRAPAERPGAQAGTPADPPETRASLQGDAGPGDKLAEGSQERRGPRVKLLSADEAQAIARGLASPHAASTASVAAPAPEGPSVGERPSEAPAATAPPRPAEAALAKTGPAAGGGSPARGGGAAEAPWLISAEPIASGGVSREEKTRLVDGPPGARRGPAPDDSEFLSPEVSALPTRRPKTEIINLSLISGETAAKRRGAGGRPTEGQASRPIQAAVTIERLAHKECAAGGSEIDRLLRVISSTLRRSRNSVLFTSASQGEGKTALACAVSLAAAAAGTRTLLLDACFMERGASRMLGADVSAGLMDLLEGVVDLKSALVCSAAEGLWMIPSGESVATERSHLGGEAMAALLNRLHGMFELIVIDAPPVGEEPAVAALAAAAGSTIVAVRARRTEEEELSSALEMLGASGASVMGLVLTYAPE